MTDSIKRLGLAKVAHTKVGTVLNRGLSGGERKRLNVAQELLTDPPVLLADGERSVLVRASVAVPRASCHSAERATTPLPGRARLSTGPL